MVTLEASTHCHLDLVYQPNQLDYEKEIKEDSGWPASLNILRIIVKLTRETTVFPSIHRIFPADRYDIRMRYTRIQR